MHLPKSFVCSRKCTWCPNVPCASLTAHFLSLTCTISHHELQNYPFASIFCKSILPLLLFLPPKMIFEFHRSEYLKSWHNFCIWWSVFQASPFTQFTCPWFRQKIVFELFSRANHLSQLLHTFCSDIKNAQTILHTNFFQILHHSLHVLLHLHYSLILPRLHNHLRSLYRFYLYSFSASLNFPGLHRLPQDHQQSHCHHYLFFYFSSSSSFISSTSFSSSSSVFPIRCHSRRRHRNPQSRHRQQSYPFHSHRFLTHRYRTMVILHRCLTRFFFSLVNRLCAPNAFWQFYKL